MKSMKCLAFAILAAAVSAQDIKFSGTLRTRTEMWDWFDSGAADPNYAFQGTLLRLSVAQQRKAFDWQAEFAVPVLLGLPENAVAAGTPGQLGAGANYFVANGRVQNSAMIFPKQLYLKLKNIGEGQSLKLGRMEFIDGTEVVPKDATLAALKRDRVAHRLLGNFAWTHVGRSYDGAQYQWQRGPNNLTLFGAVPTRGVFQTDGWGWVNTPVIYGAFTHSSAHAELRLFGLGNFDTRSAVLKTDDRPAAARRADLNQIRLGTLGAHYLVHAGQFDGLAWFAGQFGSWGTQSQRAAAYALEAGYQPSILKRLKPWLRGGYNFGSGDSNPNDNRHGTFFQALPTPRIYARFPFFNMMNNQDAFGELILRPHKNLTLRADVHSLRLANVQDLWYQGGGAFQPWTFGYTGRATNGNRGLATLYDLSADYNLNAHFAIGGYYGYAAGKSAIRAIYPKDPGGHLGYLELTCKF